MKNVQVRLADEVYKGFSQIAKEEHTTLADIMRKAVETYAIIYMYRQEGKRFAILDKHGRTESEIIIPGVTSLAPLINGAARSG